MYADQALDQNLKVKDVNPKDYYNIEMTDSLVTKRVAEKILKKVSEEDGTLFEERDQTNYHGVELYINKMLSTPNKA